jgi:hypothetical protein
MANALKPVTRRRRRATGHTGPGTLYRRSFARLAHGYAILGATQADLAKLFGVSQRTIESWMVAHREFHEAVVGGREDADARVAASYFQRACGYEVTTRRTETRERRDLAGRVIGTETVTVATEMHVPADTTAAWRWLQLRQGWGMEPPMITVEDVRRVAEAARQEAARRGISIATALEVVQEQPQPSEPVPPGKPWSKTPPDE